VIIARRRILEVEGRAAGRKGTMMDPRRSARVFANRETAGRQLAERMAEDRPEGDIVVLGLPRGGVPVAWELAEVLHAPLDVFVVRKLGAPFNPEYAVGAIAAGGVTVYNPEALAVLRLDEGKLEAIRQREQAELERRERMYRQGRPPPQLGGKTVILADDGIATGSTMRAAVEAVRHFEPASVVVAAPTGSSEAVELLEAAADRVAVLSVPEPYVAVGAWYELFPQLTDQDVVDLLARARTADEAR
jgi:putative phosphoribosyl transferase